MKGLMLKDNLSSYQTDRAIAFWENHLKKIFPLEFLPPNLTDILQVSLETYSLFCQTVSHVNSLLFTPGERSSYWYPIQMSCVFGHTKKMMRHLNEARKKMGRANIVTVPSLTPREKHIIITKVIGDFHRKISATKISFRAFIAIATWIPMIQHLREGEELDVEHLSNAAPQDEGVKLQHLPEYNYDKCCNREEVLVAVKKMRDEKENKRAELARLESERKEAMKEEADRTRPFVEKAESMIEKIFPVLEANILPHLKLNQC